MGEIINWFKRNKAKIGKAVLLLTVLVGIALGAYFALNAMGINIFGDEPDQSAVDRFKSYGFWVIFIYFLMYVTQAALLGVVPGNTTVFVLLGVLVFEQMWGSWILAVGIVVVCNWVSSIVIFFIGRCAGRGFLYWMFGKEVIEKYLQTITDKGIKIMPVLMVIPFMPNDLLTIICGASKMKFWQFLLIMFFAMTIEVFGICLYPYIYEFVTKDKAHWRL